jgi:DNA repair exonuclease SbcCD ATPase subunit
MGNLKTIKIVNLLSHEKTLHIFNANVMTLFVGKNGSGKSGINEGVSLAITGDITRGVGKDEYIKKGEDFCSVDLLMVNKVLDKKMRIVRNIFLKKTSTLDIFIDGVKKEFASISNGDAFIFSEIGFSKEDFLNYFLIAQSNNNSFFSSSDTKQKEIISRFSNYKPIDLILTKLKNEELKKLTEIAQIENSLSNINSKIEVHEESIELLKQTFDSNKAEKLNQIKEDKKYYIGLLTELVKRSETLQSDLKTKALKLKEMVVPDGDVIERNISRLKLKLKQSVAEKTEANEMESELEVIMFGKITCPKCEHNFIIGGEHNISDVEENLKQIKKLSKDIANSIIEIESKIREKRDKLSKIVTKMELSNDLKDGIDNINRAIAKIEIDNKNYTASVEKCDLKIAEEEAKTMNNEIQVIADKIEHLRGDNYNNKLKEIEAIKLSLEDNKFYQLHFSNKGFKSYLARKSIKNIQDICNWYLIKFNINLQVSISGYTTLKSGEVRDKIEVTIIRNGYERGAFKKHSGGEKNRVDLCGLLTLNKLVNNSVEYGRGLNLLIVDEYVGYLDAEGKHEIIDILSNSGITSILVMHEVGKIQYENKLYFNKINGETKISKNEK